MSRSFQEGEAIRRCNCGHVVVARAGQPCPRCRRPLADVREVSLRLVAAAALFGLEHAARLAPVLGVRGRLYIHPDRVLGVVLGGGFR